MANSSDVKNLRAILGITQKELAEKLGVSIKTIANYEAGGVIPTNKQLMIEGLLSNAKSICITGNSNITNTGITDGNIIINSSQEVILLRERIKKLEQENEDLKKDKAALHELITMFKNQDKG